MKREIKVFFFYILGILGGVIAGVILMPYLFMALKHDLKRQYYLKKAITEQEYPLPEIALLGNSIMMTIDGHYLSQRISGNPVVWNFASTAQSPLESLLMFESLPPTVHRVILGISPDVLNRKIYIDYNKFIAYRLFDYKVTPAITKIVDELHDEKLSEVLSTPAYQLSFDSRWLVSASINTTVRDIIREDVDLEKGMQDLFHPFVYLTSIDQQKILREIQVKHKPRESFHIEESTQLFFKKFNQLAKSKDIELSIIILPEHPLLSNITQENFYNNLIGEVENLKNTTAIPTYNCYNLLKSEHFVDASHPNATGAKIIVDNIVNKLNVDRYAISDY